MNNVKLKVLLCRLLVPTTIQLEEVDSYPAKEVSAGSEHHTVYLVGL